MAAYNKLPSAPEALIHRVSMAFDFAGSAADQLDSACAQLEVLIDQTLKRLT